MPNDSQTTIQPPLPRFWPANMNDIDQPGSAKLRPCPFCAGKSLVYYRKSTTLAFCTGCGAQTAAFDENHDQRHIGPGEWDYLSRVDWAVEQWNRRKPIQDDEP